MIKISYLNKECRNRIVANTIPAQILCRLLGDSKKTCPLNKICKPSDEKGMGYFYGVLIGSILGIYIILYWIIKIMHLQKPLSWLGIIIMKPLKPVFFGLAYIMKFYKGLPR